METNGNEHLCVNCRYYKSYYFKFHAEYKLSAFGSCTNMKVMCRGKKLHKFDGKTCDCWETEEIQKEERIQDIKKTIYDMKNRLDDIYLLIKDDKNL